ncbi:ABC transporter ATP-binding protein [Adlercreutzia murintestinalis]|uniref:ABC transporter ATP-binding protein n=1 Tax=Adlercreutzia murintestinalis TaxID=2941325 RepID=UPI00203B1AF2|nr:ABC transporter ATP-binding protein [Adlercreutzia murintestinalis]
MQLALENIDLRLGGKDILRDVSFAVDDGRFVSVLGESGAGKSTTLKVIAGLLPQDSGRVLFDGTCVDDVPTHKRNTAIVFQDIRLFPNMDVRQNVAFPLKMRKVPRAERLATADRMLAAVQLEGFGNRRTYELSGGQQQRVAVARALAAKPDALLLDEPFSGLDEQLRAEMRQLVSRLHAEFGMTSLMVTHDADEALTMSDRIIYMSDGRVVQEGTPADLLLRPASDVVRAAFNDASSIEGRVEGGIFMSGKLCVSLADLAAYDETRAGDAALVGARANAPVEQVAPAIPDGPAVLVRVPDRTPFVHAL